jgi:tape measure domain-containing protein
MATTTEKLILELQAKISKYNANIIDATKKTKKFQDTTAKSFTDIEKRSKRAGDSLFRFSNVAKGVFAAIGARQFVTFADSITLADNQLRNVTANTEQFNFVQMELNRIAQETRQNVNELTGVFARFTRAGQEAGISQQDLLGFTEDLTKAFKLEGNTTAEVNSTLIQLSQSFRKGRIDGEEFRALSENSTLALQALAKQLGVTIGELKDLGAQGKVAPRDLIEGLKGIGDQIDDEFGTLGPTFSELGTKLGNLLAKGFRQSGLQSLLDDFKKDFSDGLDAIDFTFTDA